MCTNEKIDIEILNGQTMIKTWKTKVKLELIYVINPIPGHITFSRFLLYIAILALFATDLLASRIVLMFPIMTYSEFVDQLPVFFFLFYTNGY